MGDLAERERWDGYMAAYEDMIRHTSIPEAPWWVVPADTGKPLEDIGSRLLAAFPDTYGIEITGGLPEIAVSRERLVKVSEGNRDFGVGGSPLWRRILVAAEPRRMFPTCKLRYAAVVDRETALRLAS